MANPRTTLAPHVTGSGASSVFDPVAYEAQDSLDGYGHRDTVWNTISLDTYMGPSGARAGFDSASPTPSPVPQLQPQMAMRGRMTQPSFMSFNPPAFPIHNFDLFLSQQPRMMQPYTSTMTYMTENGGMRFFAFAEADGEAKINMVGTVGRLQDINWQMHQRNAFSHLPMPTSWPYQNPPPPPQPFVAEPIFSASASVPSRLIFQTQSDFNALAAQQAAAAKPIKKPRKNKGKQKEI